MNWKKIGIVVGVVVIVAVLVGGTLTYHKESDQNQWYQVWDYQWPGVSENITDVEKYYGEAELEAYFLEATIDASQPFATHLWSENKIQDTSDIKNILEKEKGVCRHKVGIGFWILQWLFPDSEIVVVEGYEYGTIGVSYAWSPREFSANHVWLEKDGEIIDFMSEGTHYTPYIKIRMGKPSIPIVSFGESSEKWELRYSLEKENIASQYLYDTKVLSPQDQPDTTVPWGDPKNLPPKE